MGLFADDGQIGTPEGPMLIGVCGGSGSGKTTLAHRLVNALGPQQAVCLSFDSYYRDFAELSDERRAEVNFDHPDSLDVDLLTEHLQLLRRGHEVAVPVYDFAANTRSGDLDLVRSHRYVIVEGILLFAFEAIRAELDYLVFRRCDEATRAGRRLRRDVAERGRSARSVREQWTTTVQPMHERYVEPFAVHAHLITSPETELDDAVDEVLDGIAAAEHRMTGSVTDGRRAGPEAPPGVAQIRPAASAASVARRS